ncbi:hypothetical protein HS088_TW22G00415 [Tripterygium wilfordii]|uniref:Pectinesterase inhibitor domain-containing protein n=1 Tax=Tripterygium wilfordii TaxID=458696 RepID=A0A7J7BXX9_TRIWF|nr:pectinesterase inhibitor 12-like [Tripterygium wilfordii]KAF5726733.1 hypothetical protein HS088_TW22G00415 [Tripterygium wilfordii]
MAFKSCTSFSLVFLAMALAITFLATPAASTVDLCADADYKALCKAALRGITNPTAGTQVTIKALISETHRGIMNAKRFPGKDNIAKVCKESYEDALDNLNKSLNNVREQDKGSLNINLSAAYADFVSCDDAYSERGRVSPYARLNRHLERMASNSLAVATVLHW